MSTYERYDIDWEAYHRRAQTGPCFICCIMNRDPEFPADIIYEDDFAVAFPDKYLRLIGDTLVARREHREQVVASFTADEYLRLQQVVHRVAQAVQHAVDAERVSCCRSAAIRGTHTFTGTSFRCLGAYPMRSSSLRSSRGGCCRYLTLTKPLSLVASGLG